MPIPTVPLVIGGVVLVIGGTAAFKHFVYDPHLGPALEALAIQLRGRRRQYEPIPVPLGETDTRVEERPWARSSAYESFRGRRSLRRRNVPEEPSVEQVIFDAPSSPPQHAASRTETHATDPFNDKLQDGNVTPVASPHSLSPQPLIQEPPQSTTYSFLSLSQASSPDCPTVRLESLDAWATQGLGLTPTSPDPMVASLPSTEFSPPSSVNGTASEAESWVMTGSEDDWEHTSLPKSPV
jgi:hypothetical protein